jgi:lipopolysaccharide/colanic/teichoic acid biosynthesis glycosyltransferase
MIHTKNLEKARCNMTLVGHILRQIYMDEVPQLFSVLIGDMSFVGPRPTNPENYTKDIEKGFQSKRILRAGLTGRFQTHKHVKYKLNQEAVDLEYANLCKTASGPYLVLYDLFILFQTIVTVIRAEGL